MKAIWSFALILALLPAGRAGAQDAIQLPEDAKFVVQVDLVKFQQTNLGAKLVGAVKSIAQEEIKSITQEESDDVLATVSEAIGFDPLEELRSLTVIGTNYDEPEENLRFIIQLGQTTGNLEGLALALPNYEAEEYGPYTIHSGTFEDENAYATIHTDSSGMKRIIGASSRDALVEMLAGSGESGQPGLSTTLPEGVFAQVSVLQFPEEVFEGPQANVVKMIKSIRVAVASVEDDIKISVNLSTETEKTAEQLQQLTQGAIAMLSLFEDDIVQEIGDDENGKMAYDVVRGLSVERDGTELSASIMIPGELIIQFLREEADLPL